MANTSSISVINTSSIETPILPFDMKGSYQGDDLTRRVAEILGLNDTVGWSVIDSIDNLALVHYRDDADMNLYGHLRGVLVDTEVGAIVADSFGYTPTCVSSELTPSNGILNFKDSQGINHSFNINDVIIKRVFEGVVIRVIWHNGKCYRLTFKKINPLKSRWGPSKTFLSMYDEGCGPKPEELFDTSKLYSSTCYDFLVVDKSLLVGSRQIVNEPFTVLVSNREMDIKRPSELVAKGVPSFEKLKNISGVVNKSCVYEFDPLSLDDANQHLKYGYYQPYDAVDVRLLTGEAVLIYREVDGVVKDVIKVHSPSYDWRLSLRGSNANFVNQFYVLLNIVYGDVKNGSAWERLTSKLIPFPQYDEDSVKELYDKRKAIMSLPLGKVSNDDYSNRDSRIHLLWLNYVISLPPHLQSEALNILTNFHSERGRLIKWLQILESTVMDIENSNHSPRIKGIITSARKLSREQISNGTNYTYKGGRYINLPTLVKNTIKNLINKENGPSLYRLIKEMNMELSGKPK